MRPTICKINHTQSHIIHLRTTFNAPLYLYAAIIGWLKHILIIQYITCYSVTMTYVITVFSGVISEYTYLWINVIINIFPFKKWNGITNTGSSNCLYHYTILMLVINVVKYSYLAIFAFLWTSLMYWEKPTSLMKKRFKFI